MLRISRDSLSTNTGKRLALCVIVFVVAVTSVTGAFLYKKYSDRVAADACGDIYDPFPSWFTTRLNQNKSVYQQVANEKGVPWEMIAAVHYREVNMSTFNPYNGQGLYQLYSSGVHFPPGEVDRNEFLRQTRIAADFIQGKASASGTRTTSVTPRRLTANEGDINLIKNTLFSYNGRASVYAQTAANYGYDPASQPFEGSPYVMNKFDCARKAMGIITNDGGSTLNGIDTRMGAFTMYARLKGDSYWQSLQKPFLYQTVSQEIYTDSSMTNVIPRNNGIYSMRPGTTGYAKVTVRNIGSATWSGLITKLGTAGPQDRVSAFALNWQNAWRAGSAQERSIGPGGIATFTFPLKAPSQPGQYTERFRVVLEGKTWIQNSTTTLDISVPAPLDEKFLSANFSLKPGQQLGRGQNLISRDGHSALHMSFDGSLEVWTNYQRTWSSKTDGSGADRIVNQTDGNLVIYRGSTPVWASNTYQPGSNGNLTLQADGNLVLYRGATPVWASNTVTYDQTNLANALAGNNQVLFPGQSLFTADRYYRLTAQTDGNIVLYTPTRAIWSSGTYLKRFNKLIVQGDGNLVAYDGNRYPVWSSRTNALGDARFIVQGDGNLVLYSSGRPLWSSQTAAIR